MRRHVDRRRPEGDERDRPRVARRGRAWWRGTDRRRLRRPAATPRSRCAAAPTSSAPAATRPTRCREGFWPGHRRDARGGRDRARAARRRSSASPMPQLFDTALDRLGEGPRSWSATALDADMARPRTPPASTPRSCSPAARRGEEAEAAKDPAPGGDRGHPRGARAAIGASDGAQDPPQALLHEGLPQAARRPRRPRRRAQRRHRPGEAADGLRAAGGGDLEGARRRSRACRSRSTPMARSSTPTWSPTSPTRSRPPWPSAAGPPRRRTPSSAAASGVTISPAAARTRQRGLGIERRARSCRCAAQPPPRSPCGGCRAAPPRRARELAPSSPSSSSSASAPSAHDGHRHVMPGEAPPPRTPSSPWRVVIVRSRRAHAARLQVLDLRRAALGAVAAPSPARPLERAQLARPRPPDPLGSFIPAVLSSLLDSRRPIAPAKTSTRAMCRVLGCVAREPVSLRHELLEAREPVDPPVRAATIRAGASPCYARAEGAGPELRAASRTPPSRTRASSRRPTRAGGSSTCHVRRATLGGLGLENTHPFMLGHYSFSHNGTIITLPALRRARRGAARRRHRLRGMFNFLMHDFDPADPVRLAAQAPCAARSSARPSRASTSCSPTASGCTRTGSGIFELHWLAPTGTGCSSRPRERHRGAPGTRSHQDVLLVLDPATPEEPHAERLARRRAGSSGRTSTPSRRRRSCAVRSAAPTRPRGRSGWQRRQRVVGETRRFALLVNPAAQAAGALSSALPAEAAELDAASARSTASSRPPSVEHAREEAAAAAGERRGGRGRAAATASSGSLAGALKGTERPLAIIPGGRGNDFARVLEHPVRARARPRGSRVDGHRAAARHGGRATAGRSSASRAWASTPTRTGSPTRRRS